MPDAVLLSSTWLHTPSRVFQKLSIVFCLLTCSDCVHLSLFFVFFVLLWLSSKLFGFFSVLRSKTRSAVCTGCSILQLDAASVKTKPGTYSPWSRVGCFWDTSETHRGRTTSIFENGSDRLQRPKCSRNAVETCLVESSGLTS